MKKQLKKLPKFRNEDKERDFWDKADSSEYFDWDNPIELDLSKLKPSTESISLRLPAYLLARVMKIFLAERVENELRRKFNRQ
ncbi:MAG: hypothetical protein HYW64_01030 [Candidatus Levybacteria bacterium]|nr:hypothetical protein [Candidatus Levybacteria bacterium]